MVVTVTEPNDIISEAFDTGLDSESAGVSMFRGRGRIGDSPNISSGENDVDLFELELDAGDQVTFDIDASQNGSNLDPILRLFNSEGDEIAVNDDFNGLDSFISFNASVSDTYYVGVSSFSNFNYDPFVADSGFDSGGSTGRYTLKIDLIAAITINGTEGDDILIGTENNDAINGLGGDDVLQGENGRDTLSGGDGDDTIGGDNGADFLLGGEGEDILAGGDGADRIEGNLSDDLIAGGRGDDSLFAGAGNDTLNGDSGNDRLRGGNGNDNLRGNSGNDFIQGNAGNDFIFGGFGNDNLLGGNGRDTLNGGIGNDTLNGGAGDDELQGGIGNDFLSGGAGADRFILAAGQSGETITDFEDDIDKFVLGSGLSFENLDILSTGNETVIINNNNNVVLAVVEVTPAFIISVEDFVFDA